MRLYQINGMIDGSPFGWIWVCTRGRYLFETMFSPFASSIAAMIFIQCRVQLASFCIDSFFSNAVQCPLASKQGFGCSPHSYPISRRALLCPFSNDDILKSTLQIYITRGRFRVKVAHESQNRSPILSSTTCNQF